MTTRRQVLRLGVLGAVAPVMAKAQSRPVIGMLSSRPLRQSFYASAIVRRLGELGYMDGASMRLEFRSADSKPDAFDALARELVARKCDLIIAVGSAGTLRALQAHTKTIPLVFLAADYDPVGSGLVASLARPGGNATGVYLQSDALTAKRLELLHEVSPATKRVLFFTDAFSREQLAVAERFAEALGISITPVHFDGRPYNLEAAFETGRKADVQGLVLPASPVFAAEVQRIAAAAATRRLPLVGFVGTAEAGGLLSYSTDNNTVAARTAELGVRVLKGEKPSGIAVEQPREFLLVVNFKVAKSLGIGIPQSILVRATKIVE